MESRSDFLGDVLLKFFLSVVMFLRAAFLPRATAGAIATGDTGSGVSQRSVARFISLTMRRASQKSTISNS